jgi:hypothetical protein
MRKIPRVAFIVGIIVISAAYAGNPECRCIDPPSELSVTIHTTLTAVDIGEDFWGDLEDSVGAGELVLIIETVPLGKCAHCAQTYIRYLPRFEIQTYLDAYNNLEIPINAIIYSIAECWPPSRVAFTATLFEDDYDSDSDVLNVVRGLAPRTVDGGVVPALSADVVSAGWSFLLSGAWLSRLNNAITGGKDVIARVTTWQRSFATEDGTPNRNLPREYENTLSYGREDLPENYVWWQLHHGYGYPAGKCTAASVDTSSSGSTSSEGTKKP